jgi:thiol-disulfide isomerase/thioredoxin
MAIAWIPILLIAGTIMFWYPIYKAIPMFVEAPDFNLPALDGGTCKLSDYRGKKVVLELWSARCPHCRHEAGELEKLSKRFYKRQRNTTLIERISITLWGSAIIP